MSSNQGQWISIAPDNSGYANPIVPLPPLEKVADVKYSFKRQPPPVEKSWNQFVTCKRIPRYPATKSVGQDYTSLTRMIDYQGCSSNKEDPRNFIIEDNSKDVSDSAPPVEPQRQELKDGSLTYRGVDKKTPGFLEGEAAVDAAFMQCHTRSLDFMCPLMKTDIPSSNVPKHHNPLNLVGGDTPTRINKVWTEYELMHTADPSKRKHIPSRAARSRKARPGRPHGQELTDEDLGLRPVGIHRKSDRIRADWQIERTLDRSVPVVLNFHGNEVVINDGELDKVNSENWNPLNLPKKELHALLGRGEDGNVKVSFEVDGADGELPSELEEENGFLAKMGKMDSAFQMLVIMYAESKNKFSQMNIYLTARSFLSRTSPYRSLVLLEKFASKHELVRVREFAAELLEKLVDRMPLDKIMSEPYAKRILPMLAGFLSERRYNMGRNAKKCLIKIFMHPEFPNYLWKYVELENHHVIMNGLKSTHRLMNLPKIPETLLTQQTNLNVDWTTSTSVLYAPSVRNMSG